MAASGTASHPQAVHHLFLERFKAGDVAQLASIWPLTAKLPDGNAMDLAGIGTEIVRKQAD
jgi:ketosteroid isomerase-like protein